MMSALISQLLPYILGALALLAGLFGYGASQRARGRERAKLERLEQAQESRRNADEIADEIRRMDDADVLAEFDRLRDRLR